jgi:hypothetical protein
MHAYFVTLYSHTLSSMVTLTAIDCRMSIELSEGHFGPLGQIVTSCPLDLTSATDQGECAHFCEERATFTLGLYPYSDAA